MASVPSLPGFAVVTGAASGIGQATAKGLVAAGVFGIALLDINDAGLEATRSQLVSLSPNPSRTVIVRTFTCDCSSAESVEKTFKDIYAEFGRIDYSVHAAGTLTFESSVNVSIADFDREVAVNFRGTWLCQRSALTLMRAQSLTSDAYPDSRIPPHRAQRGSIVNVGSVLALVSVPHSPAYCGSKAGVSAITRSDGLGFSADCIRVNAVLLGIVDTPMTTSEPRRKATLEATSVQKTPFKRFGTPEEIADVVVFLCGSGASFVTGASWTVDGGYALH